MTGDLGPEDGPEDEIDVARVAAHLSGSTADEALLDEAARSPGLTALLADVVAAEAGLASGPASGAGRFGAGLSDARLTHVLASFPAGFGPAGGGPAVGPVLAPARPWRQVARAAAILVVAAPLAVLAARALGWGRGVAAPSLSIGSLVRLDVEGRLLPEAETRLPLGVRLAPAAGERVAVRLTGGARVVLGDDDVARVACDLAAAEAATRPAPDPRTGCRHAALELAQGEALLEAGPAGVAVLLLAGAGRLEVLRGAAHVALGATSIAEVALRDDGRVRWRSPRGATSEWTGPGRLLLRGEDGTFDRTSRAEESLFRDLEFFGGAPMAGRADRRVSARAFRVLSSDGDARTSEAGAPALRFDLDAGSEARLAWTLDEVAAAADEVRLLVRVRSALSGPEGAPLPDTVPPRVVFEVEEMPGASAVFEPPTEHRGPPTATSVLTIRWGGSGRPRAGPAAGTAVTLRVRAERTGARVWFEGAAFRRTASAGEAVPRPGEVPPRPAMGE